MRQETADPITTFNHLAKDYDHWFDLHPHVLASELDVLRRVVPTTGIGLEIGVGSGRFAEQLGIQYGVEPARGMRILAEKRGIRVVNAAAENLPFPDNHFEYAVFITTLCFVTDPLRSVREANRVVKPGGRVIIGFIDRDSPLGRQYQAEKQENPFYRHAKFFSAKEIEDILRNVGLVESEAFQTLFTSPDLLRGPSEVRRGFGSGGFVVICAKKID